MRPVMHGDVVAAACALLPLDPAERLPTLRMMLFEAAAADAYRKRFGKLHREWGNGSLMSVALRRGQVREPALRDLDYCRCLALVFDTLVDWRLGCSQPRAQDTQVGTVGSRSSRPGAIGSPHSEQ